MARGHSRLAVAAALAAAVALSVALPGCVTERRTSGMTLEDGQLCVEDTAFARDLALARPPAAEVLEQGLLHVQVALKNASRRDCRCQYRFEWFDGNGMAMKHAPTPWRPLLLHGRETKELDAVAPIAGAEDFRLKIRRAD